MYDTLGRGIPKGHSLELGRGLPADRLPGHRVQAAGRADRQPARARPISAPTGSAHNSICWRSSTRAACRNTRTKPDLAARVETFELAYRMQMAAPEALDLNKETDETKKLYGLDNPKATHFAKQCLIARRLVERGVRFVQIYSRRHGERPELGRPQQHREEPRRLRGRNRPADRGAARQTSSAAGCSKDTLVIWGGEFGRLPIVQKGNDGRDHNPHAITFWMAGGGVKGGVSHGATRRDRLQGRREPRQHQRLPRDRSCT